MIYISSYVLGFVLFQALSVLYFFPMNKRIGRKINPRFVPRREETSVKTVIPNKESKVKLQRNVSTKSYYYLGKRFRLFSSRSTRHYKKELLSEIYRQNKVNASLYEIWTDVNGIYSSDPRKINNTFINEIVHYDAAQEVAAMGAKVIHPYCILPCAVHSIPIHIKNTFNPDGLSTIICNKLNNTVYGVTIQDNVKVFKITSLNIHNFLIKKIK